jgi:DNA-binding LacI/PurR family transcriptional regulator
VVARLVDVAKLAGVSPSTVSYVLSGDRPISAETRARVERSIEELGFRIHAGARSIKRQRTNVIALVLPLSVEGQNEMLMQFVATVLAAASQRGMNLLLLAAEDGTAEIAKVVGSSMVDGLIVMDVQPDDPRVPILKKMGHPAVLVGAADNAEEIPAVDFDSRAAGEACFDHLFRLGHRHIGFLGYPSRVYDRETGFPILVRDGVLESMRTSDLAELWSPMEAIGRGAEDAIDQLLAQDPEISAVIVHNEKMLQRVMDRFRQLGRTIPDDISIVAICSESQAECLIPALSHVPLPIKQLSQLAFDRLVALIDGDEVQISTLIGPAFRAQESSQAIVL